MKNMKKLIISAFMLVIAFMALVSSTYAWFTSSDVATVSNIQISTVSADNLLIAYKDTTPIDSDFKTHIDWQEVDGESGLELKNVSTVDLAHWYTASSDDPNNYQIGAENEYSEVAANNLNTYVLTTNDVWLKYVGEEEAKELFVSDLRFEYPENVTPTHTDMLKCIRFGVKIGNDFYIYARGTEPADDNTTNPVTIGNNYGTGIAENDTDPSRIEIENWQLVEAENRTDYICEIQKDEVLQVQLFIWFEGEDTHCYQNNLDLNHIFVTFVFRIRDIE